MPSLALNHPGNSLAAWLAGHHPDLFLAVFKQAKAAGIAKRVQLHGLRGLGDDTTTFDASTDLTASFDPGASASILSDSTPSGASFLSSVSDTPTSWGSSVGSALASDGSSLLGALKDAGSYLTSATGLSNLTSLAKTYFAAQGAADQAQTQQQVLQTQIARATVGSTAAPITYTANGTPVYAVQTPQGIVYQPLTQQGVASLAPSSISVFLSQYGLYVGLGAVVLVGVVMMRRR